MLFIGRSIDAMTGVYFVVTRLRGIISTIHLFLCNVIADYYLAVATVVLNQDLAVIAIRTN